MTPFQVMRLRSGGASDRINMQFNDGNGVTTFPDTGSGASTWASFTGGTPGVVQQTTSVILDGVSSLMFPNNVGSEGKPYLQTSVSAGNTIPATADFSLKFLCRSSTWLNPAASGAFIISSQNATSTAPATQFTIQTNAAGKILFVYCDGTTRSVSAASSSNLAVNTDLTIEFKRVGTALSLLVNSVLYCSATFSGAFPNVNGVRVWRIGAPEGSATGGPNAVWYFDKLTLTY